MARPRCWPIRAPQPLRSRPCRSATGLLRPFFQRVARESADGGPAAGQRAEEGSDGGAAQYCGERRLQVGERGHQAGDLPLQHVPARRVGLLLQVGARSLARASASSGHSVNRMSVSSVFGMNRRAGFLLRRSDQCDRQTLRKVQERVCPRHACDPKPHATFTQSGTSAGRRFCRHEILFVRSPWRKP